MRSIAMMNQKGGVGKTTSSVNIAAALARSGKRVLLVDMDPQAHASLHFGIEPGEDFSSVYDVLTGDESIAEVARPVAENLTLIPSHLDLAAAEVELAGVVGREFILRDQLEAMMKSESGEPFDFLLIDCPPSLGVLTLNALVAVEEIIIPLQPHYLALHGLSKLLQTIRLVSRRLNNRLRLSGIILCLYESSTTLAKEITEDVEAFFATERERDGNSPWANVKIFQTKIRRNIRLAEAPSFGKPIFDYDPKSNGAEDYSALTKEILAMTPDIPNREDVETIPEEDRKGSDGEGDGPDESGPAFFNPGSLSMETD